MATTTETDPRMERASVIISEYVINSRWARVFSQRWPAATTAQKNYLRRLLASSTDAEAVEALRHWFNTTRLEGGTITGPEVSAAITYLTR